MRHRWRFAVLVAVASVLGASCSGSSPATAPKPVPVAPATTKPRAPATTAPYTTLPPRVAVGPTGQVRVNTGPRIANYKPMSSPVGGVVIINGLRLGSSTGVSFNHVPGTIKNKTPTRIKVVVPAGASTGPLTVTTPYGSATAQGFVVT